MQEQERSAGCNRRSCVLLIAPAWTRANKTAALISPHHIASEAKCSIVAAAVYDDEFMIAAQYSYGVYGAMYDWSFVQDRHYYRHAVPSRKTPLIGF
jgi:hypothetical protein